MNNIYVTKTLARVFANYAGCQQFTLWVASVTHIDLQLEPSKASCHQTITTSPCGVQRNVGYIRQCVGRDYEYDTSECTYEYNTK